MSEALPSDTNCRLISREQASDGYCWQVNVSPSDGGPARLQRVAQRLLRHDPVHMSKRMPLITLKQTCESTGRPLPDGCKGL